MATLPVLAELPDGYFVEESPRGILVLYGESARLLHEQGFGPESDGSLRASDLSGRRPLYELEAGGARFVLRRFRHGGLMRWMTGERYLDAERPFRELILSDSLLRAGIRTPRVVAARARMLPVCGWQLDVMTRRVDDALDLGYVLGLARGGEVREAVLRAILVELGNLVRLMHTHGLVHADLQPNNVLVNLRALEGASPQLWLLDLDRSFFTAELSAGMRRANLRRLYRHVRHREDRHGRTLSRSDHARFFRGYDPERSRWKKDWRAVAAGRPLGTGMHRVGWILERFFSHRPDPRSGGDVLYPPARRS